MSVAVANRYARALADVVAGKGDYRQVVQELGDFADVYRQSLEVREVFSSPAVPVNTKTKVLGAIADRLGTSVIIRNFLRVVLINYRMALLPHISEAFQRIADERLGMVRVKIIAAGALSETEQQALHARFAELTGKQVQLEYLLDEDLLGGVRAQIESTVYDGSVRGQLQRIRQRLTAQ
jgi:F-type H+-transporting ATPase subunit delta